MMNLSKNNMHDMNKRLTLFARNVLFKDPLLLWLSVWICLFTFAAEFLNITAFHFKPISYIPPNLKPMIFFSIMYPLMCIAEPRLKKFKQYHPDLCFITFYLCLATLLLNACQLTPRPTIDHVLLKFEFLPLINYIHWIHQHPTVSSILFFIYNSLELLLILSPICAYFIGSRTFKNFIQYFLLACTLGFTFYYCFPSCGPASVLPTQYFYDFQHANHIKFFQIHHGIQATTIDGGLIAFPSFHVIWAWCFTRIWRPYRFVFYAFVIWFILICCACILLGWHYSIDILGSILLIMLMETFLKKRNMLTN